MSRPHFLPLFLLILCIALPLRAASPTTQPSPQHTPFVTALLREWDQLDTNHDGTLSKDEIDQAVQNPRITGDDAVVAGTLKLMSRSTKVTLPPLTKQYFLEYDRQAKHKSQKISPTAAEAATTDVQSAVAPATMPTGMPATTRPSVAVKNAPVNWDVYFVAGQKRIGRGGDVSWPDEIKLDDLRQGALGDCFLVASIGSMVAHRPYEVSELLKPKCNGGFIVTLPEVDPFELHPLTQSELVLSSSSSGEGVWLAAMEQAYGQFREKQKGIADPEGTDIIATGGLPGAAMSLLTGHKYKRVFFATTAKRRVQDEAKMLPIFRQSLIDAMKDDRLITADITPPILPTTQPTTAPTQLAIAPATQPTTRPRQLASKPTTRPTTRPALTPDMLPKIPPDINTKHAYAVVDFDPKTDMIEIWNPHGQTFKPKGPDGLQNGYTTNHGRFHIPLKDAYSFFTSFYFETAEPATQPTTTPSKS